MVALPDNAVLSILATPLYQHGYINLQFHTSRQYLETVLDISIIYGIIDILDLAAYDSF